MPKTAHVNHHSTRSNFASTIQATSDAPEKRARQRSGRARRRSPDLAALPLAPSSDAPEKPRWDSTARKLWLGPCLVKEFLRPSVCQVLILEAFEEQDWPESIDDPLPITHDIDPKRRLHDAIKRLNRNQHCPTLSFHGNGNGEGIVCRVRTRGKGTAP
jgi:hypothetical protein